MSSRALELRAGPTALAHVRSQGLHPDDLSLVPGAAGGAKWLVLKQLDCFLFQEWLTKRSAPLDVVGSSIGSWRFAAAAVNRTSRLLDRYMHQEYSAKPDSKEVTKVARRIVHDVFDDPSRVVSHPRLRLNVMTARCTGLLASERHALLGPGLLMTAAANLIRPHWQQWSLRRHLFRHGGSSSSWAQRPGWLLEESVLSSDNLTSALLASGSIPMVLEGIRDISGAPSGVYRDGGVTDYHMPLDFSAAGGIVLFPHFAGIFKAGWFDKHLHRRKISAGVFDNVLQIYPSESFITTLPHKKIPDRHDFLNFEPGERLRIWSTVVSECGRLADEFSSWLADGCPADRVQPIAVDEP